MIKVVYTSSTGFPNPHEGGGNRIIYDLIKNISTDQFSRAYVSYTFQKDYGTGNNTPDPVSELSPKKKIGRYLVQNLPVYKRMVTSPVYYRWYFKRIDRFFRSFAPQTDCDILHAHHPLAVPYFDTARAKKILTVHSKGGFAYESKGKGFDRHFYKEHFNLLEEREREAVRVADIVTFPSNAAKELFFRVNDIDCPEEKVRVIYNGVDLDAINSIQPDTSIFRRYGIRSNAALYILNVAEHAPQKNIPLLIRAVDVMVKEHKKDVVMINVGQGGETQKLLDEVKGRGLSGHVQFLGLIPNTDVIGFMKVCGCFVLTSTNVIFDLVVLEALACGTAVFVSDDGGNREIIKHGSNGYLVNPERIDTLANTILTADITAIRSNSKYSIRDYTVQSMARYYGMLYKDILDSKS